MKRSGKITDRDWSFGIKRIEIDHSSPAQIVRIDNVIFKTKGGEYTTLLKVNKFPFIRKL